MITFYETATGVTGFKELEFPSIEAARQYMQKKFDETPGAVILDERYSKSVTTKKGEQVTTYSNYHFSLRDKASKAFYKLLQKSV